MIAVDANWSRPDASVRAATLRLMSRKNRPAKIEQATAHEQRRTDSGMCTDSLSIPSSCCLPIR